MTESSGAYILTPSNRKTSTLSTSSSNYSSYSYFDKENFYASKICESSNCNNFLNLCSLNQNKSKILLRSSQDEIILIDLKNCKVEERYQLEGFALHILLIEFNRFFVLGKNFIKFIHLGDLDLQPVYLDEKEFLEKNLEVFFC